MVGMVGFKTILQFRLSLVIQSCDGSWRLDVRVGTQEEPAGRPDFAVGDPGDKAVNMRNYGGWFSKDSM